MGYKAYLAGIGFASIFGFSFMFTRGALEYIEPFHLLGLRFALAVVTLLLLRLAGFVRVSIKLADARAMLPLVIFQPLLYFSSETVGVRLTSASHAGMMIALIPIFVTILAALWIKELPSGRQVLFVLASVGGVIFIVFMQNQGVGGGELRGSLLLLTAALMAACYNIASRHAAHRYSPIERTWLMMVVGALFFNGIALIQHAASGQLLYFFQPLIRVWPNILYLGILSSVAAFFLINYSLSYITAVQSAVFANLVTVVAIGAGVLILGEEFLWYHALGSAAILIGVWGTNRFTPSAGLYKSGQAVNDKLSQLAD